MAIKKNKGSVAEAVSALARPLCDELGYALWDVEYVRESTEYYLRITIDSEAGITIEDCERFSRAIDPVLDEADPIAESYHLEVCSPGVEREIKTPEHVAFCVGEMVQARLFAPLDGSRVWQGELLGLSDANEVELRIGETVKAIPRASISRLTTVFEF